jgi:hypothetical protein
MRDHAKLWLSRLDSRLVPFQLAAILLSLVLLQRLFAN